MVGKTWWLKKKVPWKSRDVGTFCGDQMDHQTGWYDYWSLLWPCIFPAQWWTWRWGAGRKCFMLPLLLVLKYPGPLNKYDREMLCPNPSMYGASRSVYILITLDGKCRVLIPYMESVGWWHVPQSTSLIETMLVSCFLPSTPSNQNHLCPITMELEATRKAHPLTLGLFCGPKNSSNFFNTSPNI